MTQTTTHIPERRTVCRFAWLPTRIDGQWVTLEWYEADEVESDEMWPTQLWETVARRRLP